MDQDPRAIASKSPSLSGALAKASYAALNSRPVSDKAKALIDHLTAVVEEYELSSGTRVKRRRKKATEFRSAVERLVGDLLLAPLTSAADGWVYRPVGRDHFADAPVSYRTFTRLTECLEALGLLERKDGYRRMVRIDEGDSWQQHYSHATRFRASPNLRAMAEPFGITADNIGEHYIHGLPTHPLVLRAASTRGSFGQKISGRKVKFETNERTQALEQQVKDLNQFLDVFDIRGGTHRGYIRVFNMGNTPDFDWDKGGRLYSSGEPNYQRLRKDQRARMTINGSPVVELDVRASYLTILFGILERSDELPEDPYAVPHLHREVVKKWMVATIGHNGHISRWPSQLIKDHLEKTGEDLKQHRVRDVSAQVFKHLPLFERWAELPVTWADLMYLESEAMVRTMAALMAQGIASLTVHDSLIVPEASADLAKASLKAKYLEVCGAEPTVTL